MHDHKAPQLFQILPLQPQPSPVSRELGGLKPVDHETKFLVGLDVGSTTVKAVAVDAATDRVLWQDYQRHETKQPEKTLEFLKRMETEVGINRSNTRMFLTGSGGGEIANRIGAKFVQEVTAVSLAVEKLHPEVYSVVELGGQDAKIIVFKDDNETGRKKKIPSMNDKCAGGTGAVIDKINAKLKIPDGPARRTGLSRRQAPQSGWQVRRIRGNGHQRSAEGRHTVGRTDGVSVRGDRPAESQRAHSRPHSAAARAASRRTQQFYSRDARSLAGEHSPHVEGAQS